MTKRASTGLAPADSARSRAHSEFHDTHHDATPCSERARAQSDQARTPRKKGVAILKKQMRAMQSGFSLWIRSHAEKEQKQLEESQVKEKLKQGIQEVDAKPTFSKTHTRKPNKKVVRDIVEVRRIFNDYDNNQSGFIERHEFLPLLSRLISQPKSEMDMEEVWKNWDAMDDDGSGQISMDEFERWYCNVFGIDGTPDFTNFFSQTEIPEDQIEIREVARKLGMDFVEAEKIWREFKNIDTDSSGSLEKHEFEELIKRQLANTMKKAGQKEQPEVPPKMLSKFWQDIDADNSGTVTFEEFATWYHRSFQGDVSPMEQYYQCLGSGYRSSRREAGARQSKQQLRNSGHSGPSGLGHEPPHWLGH